jgi:hypothetical protein
MRSKNKRAGHPRQGRSKRKPVEPVGKIHVIEPAEGIRMALTSGLAAHTNQVWAATATLAGGTPKPQKRVRKQPQGDRIGIVLDALWSKGIPPASELTDGVLVDRVIAEFIKRGERRRLPDRKSILRKVGRMPRR